MSTIEPGRPLPPSQAASPESDVAAAFDAASGAFASLPEPQVLTHLANVFGLARHWAHRLRRIAAGGNGSCRRARPVARGDRGACRYRRLRHGPTSPTSWGAS